MGVGGLGWGDGGGPPQRETEIHGETWEKVEIFFFLGGGISGERRGGGERELECCALHTHTHTHTHTHMLTLETSDRAMHRATAKVTGQLREREEGGERGRERDY